MSKVTDECLRRFSSVEQRLKEQEESTQELEKFQAVVLAIVGVANFIWFFFIYPWISKHIGG